MVSNDNWNIKLYKLGKIGILNAESKSTVPHHCIIDLPGWFKPRHYGVGAVAGDSGYVGEIAILTNGRFISWVEAETASGQPYSGEIVVILS